MLGRQSARQMAGNQLEVFVREQRPLTDSLGNTFVVWGKYQSMYVLYGKVALIGRGLLN